MKLYSIGHSNRSIEEFLSLLKTCRIRLIADVRAFPVSRKYPHFNRENLQQTLLQTGIEYLWLGKELGGYRKKSEGLGENSPNKSWETEGFRIYADYMLSNQFKTAAAELIEIANARMLAYMCAEKFFWRCHRKLISDYLLTQGYEVWHIVEADKIQRHELTEFAQIKDAMLTYPPQASQKELPFELEIKK